MEFLASAGQIAAYAASIISAVILVVKPIRNKVLGLGKIQDAQKCLLLDSMNRIFEVGKYAETLSENEFNRFETYYNAYVALGGDGYGDKIHDDVKTWKIS